MAGRETTVSIDGDMFLINGDPTYKGRSYKGMKIEGLLHNSRMVQATFDDLNPETRGNWDYPDGPWDPERNVREFIEAMAEYRRHGLLGITLNLQGGSPRGYGGNQIWINSAFDPKGELREDSMSRVQRVLDKADELGMVPILGYFYFGQDKRFESEQAIIDATDNATDWLIEKGYRNVIIEIANEANVGYKSNLILRPERAHELIERVKERSAGKIETPAGRLLVSTSFGGGHLPEDNVVAVADFLLIHGNGQGEPDKIRKLVDRCRNQPSYSGQPILDNEDDHFDFEKDDNNFIAAVSRYAGWGYFDYRMGEEGFDEGYQSVPVNWSISSQRKRGFFNLLAEMTGGEPVE